MEAKAGLQGSAPSEVCREGFKPFFSKPGSIIMVSLGNTNYLYVNLIIVFHDAAPSRVQACVVVPLSRKLLLMTNSLI